MVSSIADFVVDMGSDGRILNQGSLESALARDFKLLDEVQGEREELEERRLEIDAEKLGDAVPKQAAGKLMVAEEREEGHVGWSACEWLYMKLTIASVSDVSRFSDAVPRQHVEQTYPVLAHLCVGPCSATVAREPSGLCLQL